MAYMKLLVHDGTRCSYKDAYSICVRGECVVRMRLRMPDTAKRKLFRWRCTNPFSDPGGHGAAAQRELSKLLCRAADTNCTQPLSSAVQSCNSLPFRAYCSILYVAMFDFSDACYTYIYVKK